MKGKKRQSQAWKSLERKTAKKLGGERKKRGADFSQSMPDVVCKDLTVECKYRKKISKFLKGGLEQAEKYDKTGEKPPALILKEKNMRGALVLMRLDDLVVMLKNYRERGKEERNVRDSRN